MNFLCEPKVSNHASVIMNRSSNFTAKPIDPIVDEAIVAWERVGRAVFSKDGDAHGRRPSQDWDTRAVVDGLTTLRVTSARLNRSARAPSRGNRSGKD